MLKIEIIWAITSVGVIFVYFCIMIMTSYWFVQASVIKGKQLTNWQDTVFKNMQFKM